MIDIKKLLFFDIETHRVVDWDQLSKPLQLAWEHHYHDTNTWESPEDSWKQLAGLHAEFSRVICICFGYEDPTGEYRESAIYGIDEKDVLEKSRVIFDHFAKAGYVLCGHNIKACDIPYMAKRYIINGLKVPKSLIKLGLKPWEINDLDTMEFWKLGSWGNVALETVCASLNVNVKEDDLGGSNLFTYDIDKMPWDELVHYCHQDVRACYDLLNKVLPLIQ